MYYGLEIWYYFVIIINDLWYITLDFINRYGVESKVIMIFLVFFVL